MNIIFCLLSALLGAGILYLVLRKKLVAVQELDKEILRENEKARETYQLLQTEVKVLTAHKEEVSDSVERLQKYADEYLNTNMELAQQKLDQSLEKAAAAYRDEENAYQQEYLLLLEESAEGFKQTLQQQTDEANHLAKQLLELRSVVEAAVEAAKREAEKEANIDFYRLVLSEDDIEEIRKLREVLPYLRDKEPLNKVIYKVYYEKPYTDLIGRVVGLGVKTGIYKITNIENNMCYIGQAVNIADRWKQHIKRGVGAETPTRNKLYPAMYKLGPEHFSFEIVEECSRDKLDAREDYWQDYFKAKEFGYSIK